MLINANHDEKHISQLQIFFALHPGPYLSLKTKKALMENVQVHVNLYGTIDHDPLNMPSKIGLCD